LKRVVFVIDGYGKQEHHYYPILIHERFYAFSRQPWRADNADDVEHAANFVDDALRVPPRKSSGRARA
jgi:hypothetical protein